jgi:hypothetical protein
MTLDASGAKTMRLKAFNAVALTVILNAGPVSAHDWYTGLHNPQGLSCCGENDCHRVGHRYSPGTGHEVEINGRWVQIASTIILPQSSPDGLAHACYTPAYWSYPPIGIYFNVHCVILGGMS